MSAIEELVTELSRLPTIGRKSAWRLTYHLLKQPTEQSKRLARALETLADRVRRCERCNNLTEDALCSICADVLRLLDDTNHARVTARIGADRAQRGVP